MYPAKNIESSQKINEFISLKNQVNEVRLQDRLGDQNFHENMNNVFGPVNKSTEDIFEDVTRSMTQNSTKNNRASEILNNKLLELMNDRGILATYLMSPLKSLIQENLVNLH